MRDLYPTIALLVACTFATSRAHAASDRVCTQWAIHASANATTIRQVDQKWAWCLNQDEDPPLVDGKVSVAEPKSIVVPTQKVSSPAPRLYPNCHRYRSFDAKTGTFLDYGHVRRACK